MFAGFPSTMRITCPVIHGGALQSMSAGIGATSRLHAPDDSDPSDFPELRFEFSTRLDNGSLRTMFPEWAHTHGSAERYFFPHFPGILPAQRIASSGSVSKHREVSPS